MDPQLTCKAMMPMERGKGDASVEEGGEKCAQCTPTAPCTPTQAPMPPRTSKAYLSTPVANPPPKKRVSDTTEQSAEDAAASMVLSGVSPEELARQLEKTDPNRRAFGGNSLLLLAVASNHPHDLAASLVRVLKRAGAHVDPSTYAPQHCTIRRDRKLLAVLLEGCDQPAAVHIIQQCHLLELAVTENRGSSHLDCIAYLLQMGARPDQRVWHYIEEDPHKCICQSVHMLFAAAAEEPHWCKHHDTEQQPARRDSPFKMPRAAAA